MGMEIYLNTRGFDNDYQWFNVAEDNNLSVSKNWWHIKELSKLPLKEEFSVILGRIDGEKEFLLVTDIYSGRIDNKGREIKNSFLFVSDDEVILRKLTTIFLFDYEEIVGNLNESIVNSPQEKFGFITNYSNLMLDIQALLPRYAIKFEFDAESEFYSRFGEIFIESVQEDENGEEIINYNLNPIFESKLKQFLLTEVFPDNLTIIFSYFPYLTLKEIEEAKIYLAVTQKLDRLAKNIFLRDVENWAKIHMKKTPIEKIKNKLKDYQAEIVVASLIIAIFIPLIYSYINLSSKNSELEAEILALKSQEVNETQVCENGEENVTNPDLEYVSNLEDEISLIKEANQNLVDELNSLKEDLKNLDGNSDLLTENEILNNKISELEQTLNQCEDKKNREAIQRGKLAVGYRWYKDLYNKCKKGK